MRRTTFLATFAALLALLGAATGRAGSTDPRVWIEPNWCAIGGSVEISWASYVDTPPYSVTIAGMTFETDEERLTVACADLRAWVTDGLLLQSARVEFPVRVVDDDNSTAWAQPTLMLLAAAPQIEMSETYVFVGSTDLYVSSTQGHFQAPDSPDKPPVISIFRYRPVGAGEWVYVMPFRRPSAEPGGPIWALPSHVDDLEPGKEYELQAAWLWAVVLPRQPGTRWGMEWDEVLEEELSPGFEYLQQRADTWWRDSNDPRAIRWSETRRFSPPLTNVPTVQAGHSDLRVSWRGAPSGLYIVTLRSDDWPGVIWASSQVRSADSEQRPISDILWTAVISELPPNSTFDVTVDWALPDGFAPAPSMTARTRTSSAPFDASPGRADPSGYDVEVGVHDIRVRLRELDRGYLSIALHRLTDGQVATSIWALRRFDHSRELPDGRSEFVFLDLPRGSTWRLYVNSNQSWNQAFPSFCAIRDIQLASRYPHEWLDEYLYSAAQGGRGEVSSGPLPAGIGALFQDHPGCFLIDAWALWAVNNARASAP